MARAGIRLFICIILALAAIAPPALAQVGRDIEQPAARGPATTYLSTETLRNRALDALRKRTGPAPVSRVDITGDEITLWTRSSRAAYDTNSWQARRLKLPILDIDQISGPDAIEGDGIVARTEGSFFPLEDVALDRFDTVMAEARQRAGFANPGSVTSVTIARQIGLLPNPHYGDIRWTISLANDRESATVYADAAGTIIGADLSNTTRGQRLNLLDDDDWPMVEAQQALAGVLGTQQVYELRVYDTYLFVVAEHPTVPGATHDYSWYLGGVRLGFDFAPLPHFGGAAPFPMADLDLTMLPDLKRKALAAFASDGARITYMSVERPTDLANGTPEFVWDVSLRQANGETGSVLLDATGAVLETRLPESRRPVATEPWLAPATVAATLQRLAKAFGTDARFGEILINDTQASILVEDPQAAGKMASFLMDDGAPRRFGTPMPWEAELDPARSFTIAELGVLDAATLAALEQRTLQRMAMPGLAVFRYTISRSALIMEPDDSRLLLEIRAGKDDGWTGGWVTFALDGDEVDVMLP